MQLGLGISDNDTSAGGGLGLTFRDSKNTPIHRWYPYVEGFSIKYVGPVLDSLPAGSRVLDPFGGVGTIPLEANLRGLSSGFAELNPFMRFVSLTKINAAFQAAADLDRTVQILNRFLELINSDLFPAEAENTSTEAFDKVFPDRDYFEAKYLRQLLAAKELACTLTSPNDYLRDILLLALASNLVKSSKMTRRADLRRRRDDEYKDRVVDVPAFVTQTVRQYLADIKSCPLTERAVEPLAADVRQMSTRELYDIAITSPPYLNGTNYFRNTKLELWFLDFLNEESELRSFRRQAITAGINNVSGDTSPSHTFPEVESVASVLDDEARDRRIPKMVRGYFSDMYEVFAAVGDALTSGARFLMDIGDSQFYGVHVPTDELLMVVGRNAGFEVEDVTFLASRRSYDNTELRQVEIEFIKDD